MWTLKPVNRITSCLWQNQTYYTTIVPDTRSRTQSHTAKECGFPHHMTGPRNTVAASLPLCFAQAMPQPGNKNLFLHLLFFFFQIKEFLLVKGKRCRVPWSVLRKVSLHCILNKIRISRAFAEIFLLLLIRRSLSFMCAIILLVCVHFL